MNFAQILIFTPSIILGTMGLVGTVKSIPEVITVTKEDFLRKLHFKG